MVSVVASRVAMRQSTAMTSRRDSRQTHVRPRPPSTGRPAPTKVKPRSPGPQRLARHRPIERGGMPIVVRLAFIAAVVALGLGVLYVGMNGLGLIVGGLGSTVTGFVDDVTSTPSPTPTVAVRSDAPSIQQPEEPYTNQGRVDLIVTAPPGSDSDPDLRIRIYLTLPDGDPTPIQDSPIASDQKTVIPVDLTKGINDFSATINGPGGESEPSAVVRFVFDASKPKITITSPEDGSTVNGKSVRIKGKTQARSTLLARNETSGSSVGGTAGPDGAFSLDLVLANGINRITISSTDPAGNQRETQLTVRRGSGKLTVDLTASSYQFRRKDLPESVTLTATVTDPDGQALSGADVTFTLSMPGIPTVTIDGRTGANGRATFRTTIPKGATLGQGSAAVLVTSTDYGSTEDYTVISIVK
jgi:Glucodextranase, domain B